MTDTKHTTSTSKEHTQTSGFKFPFGNIGDIFKKMQHCCGDGEGSFDCCEKMQQTCGTDKQSTEER